MVHNMALFNQSLKYCSIIIIRLQYYRLIFWANFSWIVLKGTCKKPIEVFNFKDIFMAGAKDWKPLFFSSWFILISSIRKRFEHRWKCNELEKKRMKKCYSSVFLFSFWFGSDDNGYNKLGFPSNENRHKNWILLLVIYLTFSFFSTSFHFFTFRIFVWMSVCSGASGNLQICELWSTQIKMFYEPLHVSVMLSTKGKGSPEDRSIQVFRSVFDLKEVAVSLQMLNLMVK